MKLTAADEAKLKTLHPDLVKVVRRCAEISPMPFMVIETSRSPAQQKKNVANRRSQTSHSRHVRSNNKSGFACAVDLGVLDGKKINWDLDRYTALNTYMTRAAADVGVPIEWGGAWKTLRDGDHWQLPWAKYP